MAWYFFVAGAIALGRRVISQGVYSWVIGFCGVVLVGFGIYFLASGGLTFLGHGRGGELPEKGESG